MTLEFKEEGGRIEREGDAPPLALTGGTQRPGVRTLCKESDSRGLGTGPKMRWD